VINQVILALILINYKEPKMAIVSSEKYVLDGLFRVYGLFTDFEVEKKKETF
jgi:hypothetical protein